MQVPNYQAVLLAALALTAAPSTSWAVSSAEDYSHLPSCQLAEQQASILFPSLEQEVNDEGKAQAAKYVTTKPLAASEVSAAV